jgi:hypothetical protein
VTLKKSSSTLQPFDELTWNELWEFARHVCPDAKSEIRDIQARKSTRSHWDPTFSGSHPIMYAVNMPRRMCMYIAPMSMFR